MVSGLGFRAYGLKVTMLSLGLGSQASSLGLGSNVGCRGSRVALQDLGNMLVKRVSCGNETVS